jgi:hypothetical protein
VLRLPGGHDIDLLVKLERSLLPYDLSDVEEISAAVTSKGASPTLLCGPYTCDPDHPSADWNLGDVVIPFVGAQTKNLPRAVYLLEMSAVAAGKRITFPPTDIYVAPAVIDVVRQSKRIFFASDGSNTNVVVVTPADELTLAIDLSLLLASGDALTAFAVTELDTSDLTITNTGFANHLGLCDVSGFVADTIYRLAIQATGDSDVHNLSATIACYA